MHKSEKPRKHPEAYFDRFHVSSPAKVTIIPICG
jgi:hypothetical protein